jgi:membrane protease YdiL (CAAX protease family)
MNTIRKYPFLSFYVFAEMIALAVMAVQAIVYRGNPGAETAVLELLWKWCKDGAHPINAINIGRFAFETRNYPFMLIWVFASAPSISAIVISALIGGKEQVQRLFARLKPWSKEVGMGEGVRIYSVIVLAYLAVFALLMGVSRLKPDLYQLAYATLGGTPLLALLSALVLLFLDEGGSLEELGWRGFAWPLLQERMSPRTASIWLGVLWAAWHLPREIPGVLTGIRFGQWGWGRTHFSQWAGAQAQFFLYCIALTVVIGYAVNRTGGSVLPAIMIHAGTNVWSKTNALTALDQYYMPKGIDFRMILLAAIAVFLLVWAGPELGRRPKTAETPPA